MNRFWKKKVPAFLLALVMMVSLVPTAAAAKKSIKYTVAPEKTITFDEDDFKNLFEDNSKEDFERMEIISAEDMDDYGRLYVYDYAEEDDVRIKEANVADHWFYWDSDDDDDYLIEDLYFKAAKDTAGETVELECTLYGDDDDELDIIVKIEIKSGKSSSVKLTYEVSAGGEVDFDEDDFEELFEDEIDDEDFYRLKISSAEDMDDYGRLYVYDYEKDSDVRIKEGSVDDHWFYLAADADDEDYQIDDLYFAAFEDAGSETVTLEFVLEGEDDTELEGVLTIEIGKKSSSGKNSKADITYTVKPNKKVEFDEDDFKEVFEDEERDEDFYRMEIVSANKLDTYGRLYGYDYEEDEDVRIKESEVEDYWFYFSSEADDEDYLINDLYYNATGTADGKIVEMEMILCGDDGAKVDCTVRIEIGDVEDAEKESASESGDTVGDILYMTTYNTNVQLKAADFDRYLKKSFPSSSLQYVKLAGVPSVGGLYYNYYGASAYGTAARTKLTASNCDDQYFYYSPSDAIKYALSELTYVPSGTNYCAEIPFTAYGSGSKSVTGSVLISVSMKAISEVYGVVPKNTAVSFPAPSILAAVVAGTSSSFSSIQLLELPASKQGTVYVGTGTSRKADTSTLYSYADEDTWQISQLRFVPASGFTGSVEIPYAACDKNGTPIAVGKFCLGVVPSVKKFSDVTSSTWCYKYVTELASSGVIDGYTDGTYKFNNTVTYGAALKLVMLAAGYPEQAPTSSNVFSGYLDKARAEGIVTRSNVDLTKPITRLQIAQLATGALDLDTTNLSSIKPFTDTDSAHAQALNAAGIIEGYFSNGTSTYKPNNNLTRGQLSAIVWRMYNYAG